MTTLSNLYGYDNNTYDRAAQDWLNDYKFSINAYYFSDIADTLFLLIVVFMLKVYASVIYK